MLGMWIKSSSSVCRSEMLDAGIREERRVERSGGVERRGLRRNTKRKGGGELVLERII